MEKKNLLMETEQWAESLNAPVVQLCFAWKLLKNSTLFHCLLSYFISEGG